jgi:hypothetical protein
MHIGKSEGKETFSHRPVHTSGHPQEYAEIASDNAISIFTKLVNSVWRSACKENYDLKSDVDERVVLPVERRTVLGPKPPLKSHIQLDPDESMPRICRQVAPPKMVYTSQPGKSMGKTQYLQNRGVSQ